MLTPQHTRRVGPYANHPAVEAAQVLLDKDAPLEAFYTYALKLTWPDLEDGYTPRWCAQMERISRTITRRPACEWWREEDEHWQRARRSPKKSWSKSAFILFEALRRRRDRAVGVHA